MEALQTMQYRGHKIEIYYDSDTESPRQWDNIAEFHCCHRRYSLGDKTYTSGQECREAAQVAQKQGDIVLPLYLYDHSGITISLTPFSCPWDSGQIGYCIVRRDTMLKEFHAKKWTPSLKDKAIQLAQGEVKTYDQYLRGEVYGYVVDDFEGFSCWGYYDIQECIDEAKLSVDYMVQKQMQGHCQKLKQWILNKVPFQYRYASNEQ
jgi:hypothetical protein